VRSGAQRRQLCVGHVLGFVDENRQTHALLGGGGDILEHLCEVHLEDPGVRVPAADLREVETEAPHGLADTVQPVEHLRLGRQACFDALEGNVPLGQLGITSHQGSRATPGAGCVGVPHRIHVLYLVIAFSSDFQEKLIVR
jgi:hypothetical protein